MKYVVKDAAGEYVANGGKRTPASNEALEFRTLRGAETVVFRETDCIYSRDDDGTETVLDIKPPEKIE